MPAPTFEATIENIDQLTYNVRGFRFRLPSDIDFNFKPGQFVIMHIPHEGKTVKRAYSIASAPHEKGILEFCIQKLEGGIASNFFWNVKEHTKLTFGGPHGTFYLKEPLDYEPVFMPTGTGVAPFRSMIKHLLHINYTKPIWLLFGTRYEHSLLYESEFRKFSKLRRNFKYIPTVSRAKEWSGERGHVQDTFAKYFPNVPEDTANKQIYLCGWDKVVKAVSTDLADKGIPQEQIHFEEWT